MRAQRIVDELAASLGRSVVVSDLDHRPVLASAQEDDIDDLRATTLLRRRTPTRVRAHLDALGVTRSRQAQRVRLAQFGGRERLAVPVVDGPDVVAVLWLVTEGHPPLGAEDLRTVEAACRLLQPCLVDDRDDDVVPDRRELLRRLLSDDEAESTAAYRDTVGRRWLRHGAGSVVVLARLAPGTTPVTAEAIALRLDASRSPAVVAPGLTPDGFVVVAAADDRDAAVDAVRAACRRAAVDVVAVGTAEVGPEELRVPPAVERASLAARLAEAVPELDGCAAVEQVGVWALVDRVGADLGDLAVLSPAAHILLSGADDAQLETVEVYLDAGGSARETCERLHVHRTTLYYRLEHLPPEVRAALADGPARSALHVCLKLARYRGGAGSPPSTPRPG